MNDSIVYLHVLMNLEIPSTILPFTGVCYMIVYLTNQILLVESTVIFCSDFHVALNFVDRSLLIINQELLGDLITYTCFNLFLLFLDPKLL